MGSNLSKHVLNFSRTATCSVSLPQDDLLVDTAIRASRQQEVDSAHQEFQKPSPAKSERTPPAVRKPRVGPPPDTAKALAAWGSTSEAHLEDWTRPVTLPPGFEMPKPEEYRTWKGHPLDALFGDNPFTWPIDMGGSPDIRGPPRRLAFPDVAYDALPSFETVPLLPSTFPLEIASVKGFDIVAHNSRTIVLRAWREDGTSRVIKLYTKNAYTWAPARFKDERDAYAMFNSDNGVAQVRGMVPQCYGWFEIEDLYLCGVLPRKDSGKFSSNWMHYGCYGLELEYIDGTPITAQTVSIQTANAALRVVEAVHKCGVVHMDNKPESFLVKQDNSVIILGFDCSHTSPHFSANLLSMWRELYTLWNMFFVGMLPDKRIGLVRTWRGSADVERYTFDLVAEDALLSESNQE